MHPQIYSPGAGHRPMSPELPGRGHIGADWRETLAEVESSGRRRVVDTVYTGLRGVGKTVLLGELADSAKEHGFEAVRLQSTHHQGVLDELVVAIDRAVSTRPEPFWARALAALRRVSGVQVAGFGVSVEPGDTAATPLGRSGGHLAHTLAELAADISGAQGRGGLLITVDELQTAPPQDMEILGATLHQLNTAYPAAPVILLGAGLPNTRDAMIGPDLDRPLITHPERLFRFVELPAMLDRPAVTMALIEPSLGAGGRWSDDAVSRVLEITHGYPAHLQVVAAETWRQAPTSHIGSDDVERALPTAAGTIEDQYLAPRWNRLSDRQQEYLAALAVAGGTATARQLQTLLDRKAGALSQVRSALLVRGEIYSPRSRVVALSMPLMDSYAIAVYPASRDNSDLRNKLVSLDELRTREAAWQLESDRRRSVGAGPAG